MASRRTKSIIWTGSIAAITVTGAWYGAGLKIEKEQKQETQRRREASSAEKIAVLERHRGALIAKRLGLEKKIHEVEMRSQGATRAESMVGRERRR